MHTLGVVTAYSALLLASYITARGTVILTVRTWQKSASVRESLRTGWGHPAGFLACVAALAVVAPSGRGAVAFAMTIGFGVGAYVVTPPPTVEDETVFVSAPSPEHIYDWDTDEVFDPRDTTSIDMSNVIPLHREAEALSR